nr:uncharacterized protein LOC126055093 [Helicoverpa armigera]
MFAQLFTLVCACALGTTSQLPPYVDYEMAIQSALTTLEENVLSVDGDIPQLDDPKRHYIPIINVILEGAKRRDGCFIPDYDGQYPEIVNASLAQGLANPQGVVTELSELIEVLRNITKQIVNMVEPYLKEESSEHADELIAEGITLKQNLEKENDVYLAVGAAAQALDKINPFLLETALNYTTTTFAVEDKEYVLKDAIEKTANVYRSVKTWRGLVGCY